MDEWTESYELLFPVEQLHAIGVITLSFSFAERELHLILWRYYNLNFKTGAELTFDMGNTTLIQKIRYVLEETETNEHLKEALLHGIECFDRCRKNRNRVAHFTVRKSDFDEILIRPNRGKKPNVKVHSASLPELRQAADSSFATWLYLGSLGMLINRRGRSKEDRATIGLSDLPNRPSVPCELIEIHMDE